MRTSTRLAVLANGIKPLATTARQIMASARPDGITFRTIERIAIDLDCAVRSLEHEVKILRRVNE